MPLILIFIGSGLGGVTRWALSNWLNDSYPLGTFLANILGCFLIGLLSKILPTDASTRLLLITGFCGGFTTFSTFINENLLYLKGGQLLIAIAYVSLSLATGLFAAWLGARV